MPVTNAKLNASHIDAIHAITESAAVLSDIFRDQQNKYDDLVTHCKAIDAEKVQCHNRAEAMKRERDTLIAEQMKREAEDEEKIIAAQQAAFAFTAQMTSYAQDDNEIRNNIANLQGQWAAFAKKWAAKDISALYQQGDAKFLEICKRSYISADERNSENGIFTQDNFPSSGRLFLLAQLAHFICWNLVNTPFFSLTGIEGEEIDGDIEDLYRPTSVLESMTNQLIRSDPGAGHAWRAQTVGLFGLPRGNDKMTPAQSAAARRREARYSEMAHEFDRGQSQCLYANCSQSDYVQRLIQLKKLLHETGEYFTRLWSQRVLIKTMDMEDFRGQLFRIASDEYDPHPRLKLETDDTRLDGNRIQMVVQPAIVAFGTEQGEGYDKVRKMWSKATVWVSSVRESNLAIDVNAVNGQMSRQHARDPVSAYSAVTSLTPPANGDGAIEQCHECANKPSGANEERKFGDSKSSLTQEATSKSQIIQPITRHNHVGTSQYFPPNTTQENYPAQMDYTLRPITSNKAKFSSWSFKPSKSSKRVY